MENREIKYKVILKKEKNNIRDCWGIDFKEKKALVSISGYFEWHHYKELIQFTGLWDKNEIEVFEGYIFKRNNHYGFVRSSVSGLWVLEFNDGKILNLYCDYDWDWFVNQNEIKGNIHQNPELLND
ncbi:MAG: hypothetical protein IH795_00805 [Bacteroidetes bacterium]|nr:hypothetical protein [Bacteroidota bacterium]